MSIKGRIHSVETFGTVDGPGIRYIVFFQGCPLKCKFCHNRDTWNLQGGKETTVEAVVEDIKKYIPFMNASGGGVTISGGEPTLQMEFLLSLLKELKKYDIHVALDTSGFIKLQPELEEILKYIDLVLLDIKHMSPKKHKDLTGVANDRILSFAKYIDAKGIDIWIRHVVIPTLTNGIEDIELMAQFILSLNSVKKVELLPYHSMGKFKWKTIEGFYPLENIPDATEGDLLKAKHSFAQYGLNISSESKLA
ncbi:pyruvate formate-lyase-activating protein [Natronincola ferrireducens]|uniref:Pyruvate formate-lyase-activating enzyme n=1 Tax=Natronincola ferrireducens TaxID=393762 RepID=A0A1G9D868_9FIRM|nr:pyruvate formate-lyase-activating protein [Natronincola ferrireducens]SDK60082.1 pyruvate formate lyase activating enzyme [Natronincola ferrireducens]